MKFKTMVRKQMGSTLVLIAAGLVPLLGAGALAVDIGFYFVVRNQLQNVVDAAALAGAQGLLADPGNYDDDGQAKQLAIQIAAQNQAAGQPVNLSPYEITFPEGNIVRVAITRPAPTFFARILGISSVNIQVRSAASVAPVNGVGGGPGGGGMRPWALLDQFGHGPLCVPPNDDEVNVPPHGPFDDQNSHTWMGITAVDHYKSPYDPDFDGWDLSSESDCGQVTGFIAPRDTDGQLIELKGKGNGKNPWRTPGNFGGAALGGRGANVYKDNITYGYDGIVRISDVIETEPGVMTGPTRVGVAALIALDQSARMEMNSAGRWVVVSDNYSVNESPRIVPIPMYSVYDPPKNGRSDFTVASIAFFFIEGTDGKDVWGRFVHARAKNGEAGEPSTNAGSQSVGGGGRLGGTVRLIDPEE